MEKKILQICAIDLTVSKLLAPLINKSNCQGFETHVACSDTGFTKELRNQFSHVHNIKIERRISPLKNVLTIIQLIKLIRKEKFDIVHVHTPVAAVLGRVAAKIAGVENIIYTAHGFYFHEGMSPRQYKVFYKIEKLFAKYLTDWLLLQSKEDYQLAVDNNFISQERAIHLSNGVDLVNRFNPTIIEEGKTLKLKQELGLKEDDIVFTFIGRLVREKGILELLKAFKKVSEIHPNAKLLLIGDLSHSERDQNAIKEIKKLLNQSNIEHLGFRNDTEYLLNVSDVFVLPSYREGLPRSIIEAMAMNNAIIATNIRGCREEVMEGTNGFLIERKSIKELKEAMIKMIEQPEEREAFKEESRKIALKEFNEEKVLLKQMVLFEKLLEE